MGFVGGPSRDGPASGEKISHFCRLEILGSTLEATQVQIDGFSRYFLYKSQQNRVVSVGD